MFFRLTALILISFLVSCASLTNRETASTKSQSYEPYKNVER
jgi:hypothetical protein